MRFSVWLAKGIPNLCCRKDALKPSDSEKLKLRDWAKAEKTNESNNKNAGLKSSGVEIWCKALN